jgi:hypothetical protein
MKSAANKKGFHHGDTETRRHLGQIAKITIIAKIAVIERQTNNQDFSAHGTPGQATEKYQRTRKNAIGAFEKLLRILLATLREIFDENAYQRFLARTGSTASVQSYREFMRERETAMATKPRCC